LNHYHISPVGGNIMNQRLIVLASLIVGLLSVILVVGSVLAQGGVSGSGEQPDRLSPAGASPTEGAPATIQPGSAEAESSASSEQTPYTAGAPVVEREPGNGAVGRSGMAPNAPAYNSTIRFVGSTLRPRQNNVTYTTNNGGGCIYVTAGDASTVWNYPLALPQGAKVEWLRMYYYDADPTDFTTGWFTKYDLYGSLVQEWSVKSLDGGNGYQDVEISPTESIDYTGFSYVLNWRPNAITSSLQLCGFRLFYTAPVGGVYLPVVVHQ
jgi:hypothetical protein